MVIMQKYHSLSYNNIADVLGRKPSWVKWQMKIAYDLLGVELQRTGNSAAGKTDKAAPRKKMAKRPPAAKMGGGN